MHTTHKNGANSVPASPEDNNFKAQLQISYDGFFKKPQSMKELSVSTGIDRSNVCRFCGLWRRSQQVEVFKRSKCSITKRIVNMYTTNPALFTISPQLKLF